MPFTPPSKQAPETPSVPAVAMPWLHAMPQYAAPDQAQGVAQEGAQSQSKNRAQDLEDLSRLINELLPSNHKDKDVEIMLNVFQDRKACDTILVCHLMSHVWGEFAKSDIARVIQARDVCKFSDDDDYRSFQVNRIVTLMKIPGSGEFGGRVKEIFDAKSQWKKWLKVEEKFSLRGRKRNENDKDENAAWKIWSETKAELEKLKELDNLPFQTDDGKPIRSHGSLSG